MASAQFSRRVGKVLGYPPLSEMSDLQRREFQEALFDDSVGSKSRCMRTWISARSLQSCAFSRVTT
jgi:hypothetical protein